MLFSIYYRSANGILLCYDLTCRQSFESLRRWLDDVSKFAAPNVCKVLVGRFVGSFILSHYILPEHFNGKVTDLKS